MVDREKPEVDSRDKGKHTGRNGLLFVCMHVCNIYYMRQMHIK